MSAAYSKAELELKTDEELQQIADLLGLSLSPESATTNEYIDAIMEFRPREPAVTAAKKASAAKAKVEPAKDAPKRVRIIVHSTDTQDNAKFIKPMINGVMYTIPKETPCEVPIEVLSALDTAIMTAMRQVDGEMITTEVRRFPYTNLGPA
jgi:hypothetical protein